MINNEKVKTLRLKLSNQLRKARRGLLVKSQIDQVVPDRIDQLVHRLEEIK